MGRHRSRPRSVAYPEAGAAQRLSPIKVMGRVLVIARGFCRDDQRRRCCSAMRSVDEVCRPRLGDKAAALAVRVASPSKGQHTRSTPPGRPVGWRVFLPTSERFGCPIPGKMPRPFVAGLLLWFTVIRPRPVKDCEGKGTPPPPPWATC